MPVGGGNYSIHRWTGSTWVDLPGGGIRIDVDRHGNPWVIDGNIAIHRWTGSGWQQVPGGAQDIGAH